MANAVYEVHPLRVVTPELIEDMRRRHAAGQSYNRIALGLGLASSTVRYHLHPGFKEEQRARYKEWTKRNPVRFKQRNLVSRLRRNAFVEHQETGVPLDEIYKRWKIKPPRHPDRSQCLPSTSTSKQDQQSI